MPNVDLILRQSLDHIATIYRQQKQDVWITECTRKGGKAWIRIAILLAVYLESAVGQRPRFLVLLD